jgi:flavin reductase (DIM6/NTAB) family NADH-FMN oxidoreductase RutF
MLTAGILELVIGHWLLSFDMDRTAAAALFAWLDRELWLVTAQAGSRRGGLIATFVNQASLSPDFPRVIIGLAQQHFTWELIEESGAFGLHLLGQDNVNWIPHFGLKSGRDVDKLDGFPLHTALTGSPLTDAAIGWLDCQVESKLHVGDRTLYLAQVVQSQVNNYGPPVTAWQLQQVLPPEVLSELKRLVHSDGQIDAQAIRTWREQNDITPLGQQQP